MLFLCLSNHYAMNTYGGEWLTYMHSRFTVKEEPSIRPTHWIGGWLIRITGLLATQRQSSPSSLSFRP